MLSRLYEPKHVALTCLNPHPEIETENHQAYVTLHLSSAEKFQLNVSVQRHSKIFKERILNH